MTATGRKSKGVNPIFRVSKAHLEMIGLTAAACDDYLARAVGAVERSIGPVHHFKAMQCVAAYVQACAVLHAAHLTAAALDRNTAAIKAKANAPCQ